MKRLDLDLARPRRRKLLAWVLLAGSLLLAVDALLQHADLSEAVARAEAPAPRGGRLAAQRAVEPAMARQLQQAERVLQRLSLPWEDLFHAVESAAADRVTLLTLAPDAGKGEVSISGEAAAYADVLAYVDRLGRQGPLQAVHLVRHEVRQDDPQQPLLFTVVARWRPAR